MATKGSRIKLLCFWILLLIPVSAFLEVSSWILIENSIPSRIRSRVGRGSPQFHVLQRTKTRYLQPDLIRKASASPGSQYGDGSDLLMFHPVLGWDYPPGVLYRDLDGIIYTHGPDGSRRTATRFESSSIATYGDSFTYGTNVRDEDTWQSFLAERLGSSVLNFGVAGYGTDQAYLKYRLQNHASTKIVMLCIWPENINRVVNTYRPFLHYNERLGLTKPRFVQVGAEFELVPNALRRRSDVAKLDDPSFLAELGKMDYWFQLDRKLSDISFPYLLSVIRWRVPIFKQVAMSARRYISSAAGTGYAWNLFDEPKPLAVMRHVIDRFVETARCRGSLPIIVILPHRDQVRELIDYRISRVEKLLRYLKARNYHYLDIMQAMADMRPDAAQLERWYDHHSTREGNQVIAKIMAQYLEKNCAELIEPGPVKKPETGLVAHRKTEVRR
jgi:lysophospholipase L1-like esterase